MTNDPAASERLDITVADLNLCIQEALRKTVDELIRIWAADLLRESLLASGPALELNLSAEMEPTL